MRVILNVIWLIFGGIEMAFGWWFVALIAGISIIGLPWARAAFNIGLYALWPFGSDAVSREQVNGREDIGTGALGFIGNVIWLIFAGWWLALGHLAICFLFAITIIGLPFAYVHLKLVGISLWPIGKMIVATDDGPVRARF